MKISPRILQAQKYLSCKMIILITVKNGSIYLYEQGMTRRQGQIYCLRMRSDRQLNTGVSGGDVTPT